MPRITTLFAFAVAAVVAATTSAQAFDMSSMMSEEHREEKCTECLDKIESDAGTVPDGADGACKYWAKLLLSYGKCVRKCDFDRLRDLVTDAKDQAKNSCVTDVLQPRVECAKCVAGAYSDAFLGAGQGQSTDQKCDQLSRKLEHCKSKECRLSGEIFEDHFEHVMNQTDFVCDGKFEETNFRMCGKCIKDATKDVRNATDEDRCEAITDAIADVKECGETQNCKIDFHGFIDGLEELVDNDGDGTCLGSNNDESFKCMRCVSRELNATRSYEGLATDRCEWVERRIDALQACAESECENDSRPLQARLEHWQDTMEEKIGDVDCEFSLDKLPFAKCARCALPYLASGDVQTGDTPCSGISDAAKGMKNCRKTQCDEDHTSLADAINELDETAGSTCPLTEVTEMCTECLSDLKTMFEGYGEAGSQTCDNMKNMGSELKACAKMCKTKFLNRTGIKELLQKMARKIKGKSLCPEAEEDAIIDEFLTFAATEGFDIVVECDKATETCDDGGAAASVSVAISAFVAAVVAASTVLA